MTATRQNLTNLLCYDERTIKIGERIITDLAKDALVAIHEHDVLRLEGLTVDADDGSWVRFARDTSASREQRHREDEKYIKPVIDFIVGAPFIIQMVAGILAFLAAFFVARFVIPAVFILFRSRG
jgi:hypothetical protein